ncbi:MAG: hypothetical protein EZS28_050762, partial [Streblomastix strix]
MQGNANERLLIHLLEVKDLYVGSKHSLGQYKLIEIEVDMKVRFYKIGEHSEGQKTSTTARRVQLSEIADNGLVSTYGVAQSSENRSVENTGMGWQVEVGQKNDGRFEMVGSDNWGQQSKDVRIENTYIQSKYRSGDNRMGSGIGGNGGEQGIGGESRWRSYTAVWERIQKEGRR